jgi:tetratricopeptide (TPR) repeat protein
MNPGAEESAALVRADVLVLLREKRYEEALARLYQARAEAPDSVELQKSLEQVKEFLIGAYAKRLGGLDQIARQIPPAAGRSPDVVLLSRYINGISTYGDLAEMCPLGKLRTLQVLIEMYKPTATPMISVAEAPYSGPRTLEAPLDHPARVNVIEAVEEAPPETARSASSVPAPPSDSPEARRYRDAFARGTAAFIQRRFADAVEAFEDCASLRPGDGAAAVMLRRARRDLESL